MPSEEQDQDLTAFAEAMLSNIAGELEIVQGLFYIRNKNTDTFTVAGKFAYFGEEEPQDFDMGVSLPGQTAKNQIVLNLTKIPENYFTILSGLGSSSPNSLFFIPLLYEGKTIGLIELASFKNFDKATEKIFNQLTERIGKRLAEKI